VALPDPQLLEDVGLTLYERKSLMALMLCGVADAATLCREGAVPSSKIYLAMEKLAPLTLKPTPLVVSTAVRPLFNAPPLPTNRLAPVMVKESTLAPSIVPAIVPGVWVSAKFAVAGAG